MTIVRFKKRYYSLSFFIAIFVAACIIFSDQMFNVFTFIPYKGNNILKEQQINLNGQYKAVNVDINNIEMKNKEYLKYKIYPLKLKKNLNTFLKKFSNKIKIFTIEVKEIQPDKKYYNIAQVVLVGKSKNEYITQKFVNKSIIKLINEMFPNNSSNITVKNNLISFTYFKINPNKIIKEKK